jgi:MFS transporter, DHA2 family, multidrug resistance protein
LELGGGTEFCIAFACVMNANFTSAWSAENYFRTELLMAVGQSFAMIGLVATILLQALFSGGLDSPQRILTFSAFFHTVRLFGGQIGVAGMTHFIPEREKLHSYLLGLQVQPGDWISDGTLRNLTAGLASKSSGLAAAAGRAVGLVDSKVRLQAYALTFIDAFHLIAWTCVFALLLIAMLRRSPLNVGDLVRQSINAPRKDKP